MGTGFICVQPAFWSETCWAPGDITYRPGEADERTYTEDELRRNSWCFYFNQGSAKPQDAVGKIINGYNRNDYALWAMVCDDYYVRNRGRHYSRPYTPPIPAVPPTTPEVPASPDYRLAVSALGSADPSWEHDDSLNLAHQVPAMLGRDSVTRNGVSKPCCRPDYQPDDLQSPQGQITMAPNLPQAIDLNASDDGWHEHSHKGQKGREDQDIEGFLDDLNAEDQASGNRSSVAQPSVPVLQAQGTQAQGTGFLWHAQCSGRVGIRQGKSIPAGPCSRHGFGGAAASAFSPVCGSYCPAWSTARWTARMMASLL